MKKLTIISAIAMSGFIYNTASAQIGIHLGLRFNSPKVYVPARVAVEQAPVYDQPVQADYNADDDYYYLPDVDAYYSVSEQCYYYFDGDNWVSAAYLPGAYHDYDWRNEPRYEVRASRPYLNDEAYRSRYNGRQVSGFNRNTNQGYANSNRFNNGNSGQNRYSQPVEQNREHGYTQPAQRTESRGSFGQQSYQNGSQDRGNRGGNSQPSYQNGSQDRGNRGGNSQPSYQNGSQDRGNRGGNSQPSYQNGRQDRGNGGGGQHFTQNSPQGGFNTHKMSKF